MPFDRTTGKPLQNFEGEDYSVLTGELLLNKMKKDKSVVFVTAAVPSNVGFPKENREKAGNQWYQRNFYPENVRPVFTGCMYQSKSGYYNFELFVCTWAE